jgi:hypothetical protein
MLPLITAPYQTEELAAIFTLPTIVAEGAINEASLITGTC